MPGRDGIVHLCVFWRTLPGVRFFYASGQSLQKGVVMDLSFGVAGPGRVGMSLAKAFAAAGLSCAGVYGGTHAKARAAELGVRHFNEPLAFRSTPFKSSFRPVEASTKSGADTR